MTVGLFKMKKHGKRIVYLLASVFLFFGFSYSIVLTCTKKLEIGKTFYFLVSDSTHIEASTHAAKLQGGAGYLLSFGKKEYVAYAVYISKDVGNAVQATLTQQGEDVRLIERKAETLYLQTRKEKKNLKIYQNAFNVLYDCMQVLNGEITRLEGGATQPSSKKIVRRLSRQLDYLFEEYETSYSSFASLCKGAGAELSMIANDTIYAKDLRYVLCELADGYLKLISSFAW